MAYADQLYEVVDRFFMQIVMPYGVKNGEAAVYLKKFTPFKKKNFDEYVQAYNDYMNAAEALSMDGIEVPEDGLPQRMLSSEPKEFREAVQKKCRILWVSEP